MSPCSFYFYLFENLCSWIFCLFLLNAFPFLLSKILKIVLINCLSIFFRNQSAKTPLQTHLWGVKSTFFKLHCIVQIFSAYSSHILHYFMSIFQWTFSDVILIFLFECKVSLIRNKLMMNSLVHWLSAWHAAINTTGLLFLLAHSDFFEYCVIFFPVL